MTVYVDDMRARLGSMILCHMVADTDEELHAMADRVGVARRWHQAPPEHDSHYDIAISRKRAAIAAGAVPVTHRHLGLMVVRRRIIGALGTPEEAEAWHRQRVAARSVKSRAA
jgi:hypothetical protein